MRTVDPECPDPDIVRHKAWVRVRTGHDRRDNITALLPFTYDGKAKAPRWIAFLERFLPNASVRRFVQVAAGLGLLGVAEQVLIFHEGNGANGKSVFLECVCRVLGALAGGLPAGALIDDGDEALKPSPELARLYGKRFARITEIKENVPIQEPLLKRLTGSEAIPVRNLFEGYFEYIPIFIPHASGNGYPRISGTDNGIWRRMRVVNWPITLSDEEQRPFDDVVGELMEDAAGIFAWLVEGARIYCEEGLIAPEAVKVETSKFRDQMDSIGRFVRNCVSMTGDPENAIRGKDFYDAYCRWAESVPLKPATATRFGIDIKKIKGMAWDENPYVVYRGVTLKNVPPRSPAYADDRDGGWQ